MAMPQLALRLLRAGTLALLLAPADALRLGRACMMAEELRTPSVSLLGFRPSIPPVDPQQAPVLRVQSGSPAAPFWVSDEVGLAVLDTGRQFVWEPNENTVEELPPVMGGMTSQTGMGLDSLVVCGSAGLAAVNALTGTAGKVDLNGLNVISDPTAVLPLADGRVIIACGPSGQIVCLDTEAEPLQLLESVGGRVQDMCVTEGEKALVLVVDGAVLRVALDVDLNAALPVEFLPASMSVSSVATDRQANVYACTSDGVQVFDEEGDALLIITLPDAATGCCFGGMGLSTLFITAGDGVWSVNTNAQGVAPPSEEFRRMMDKYVSAGDFRHDGW